jgi:hypothetical protein
MEYTPEQIQDIINENKRLKETLAQIVNLATAPAPEPKRIPTYRAFTDDEVRDIRKMREGGAKYKVILEKYKDNAKSESHLCLIVKRKCYKDVK